MNWLTTLLTIGLPAAQTAVLVTQGVHADKVAGKDKMVIATDAFNTMVKGMLPTLPGPQQQMGALLAVLTGSLMQTAYAMTKANGTYDAATKAAQDGHAVVNNTAPEVALQTAQ